MRKKQIFLYLGIFLTAVLAMLGIAFGISQAIRAGNLAGIDWYNTYDKEFVITTEEELYDLVTLSDYYDFAGQTIKLGADIVVNEGNAEDWKKEAPAKKWQPITEFAGTFDGQGHSISGLYGKSSSMSMGLFSETKETCVIKDFKVLNSFFTNSTNNGVGSILGEGAGKLEQIYSDAIIYGEGESNGGIAGLIKDELEITECWFDGTVIGEQRSNGGIIGWADRKADVTIDNCLNSGLIQFIGEGSAKTGGFIGGISDIAYRTDVSQVAITNSLTTGEIDVTNTSMAGVAIGTIRTIGALTFNNTYAVVEVTDDPVSETIFGSSNGKLTGNAIPRYRQNLIGVGGYQWTDLDFDKYWTCVEGDTPILKCFADEELSLAGVEKKVDTSWYQEGQTEFVLEDAADLWGFAMLSANTNFEGVTIKLGADITINDSDKSTWKEKAPEYNWFPIYSFSGVFDGQEHTISGLYVYSNGKRMSLFQQVNANGSIANFSLVNSYIRGSYCIGAVVAHGGGNISNIYCDAVVENTGEHTGGILGAMNQNGTISNCWFDGEVHGGTSYTGGITSAAMSSMGVITHCLNTGDIYGGTKNSTGGLVGIVNNTLTLSDSLNAGKVDDTLSSNKNRTGSVIGRIFDSTETLTVTTNISSTYTTRESYETSIGQGFPASGAPAVNSLAELKGNEGYRRTLLNFEKYWAIDKDSHPTLQSFTDEIPALPTNVKRPIVADISWFDYDENVFVINTAEELYGFAQLTGKNDFEGKTVKLGKNITINTGNSASWGSSTPLNQWAAIHRFNGTFDGQGHTISGLFANDGLWKVGLFGDVPEKGVIKNVKVTNSYFEGRYHVGAIAGMLTNATMQGVYSDANIVVRKGHGGGLIGTLYESKVDNAWFAGSVKGDCNYIGGIASFISTTDSEKNTGSVLSNCLNTGTVNGVSNVGGIVGRVAAKGTIKYSLGAGTVTGAKNTGSIVGVVVNDDITSCNLAEGVYATKESAKKTVGNGGGNGAAIVNTTAELTGVGGYQRTILDFNKYWSIVETSTPILKKFAGSTLAIPNVARATEPDTSWYNAKKDTFVLTDYADLYGLAVLSGSNDFAGKTIKLGGNIVANEGNAADFKTNTPLNQLVPVSNFAGTFDGQGYTISGLTANNESAWYVGVIGKTQEGAVVKNVKVENSYLTGEYHIGSVVGQGVGVTIENVYSDAIMEASSGHLGGIIGTISGGSISNCWFDGSVTATKDYAGGITSFVGDGSTVTISHCLNTALIKAKNQAAGIVGRVGNDAKLTLSDSLNTALINGMGASGSVVGRVMETADVTLINVYGTQESAGRLVGKGSYKGEMPLLAKNCLEGISAYILTELDFDNYWVAKAGETPVLKRFADMTDAEILSIQGVERKDTSWYNEKADTFTLNNRAELLGFAYLVNEGNDFAGKTVRLGKDIVFNEESAEKYAKNAPAYRWTPIGKVNGVSFAGTFDGQGKTISGLYATGKNGIGFFVQTAEGSVVKNFQIKNSYFKGTEGVGSVCGWYSAGTFDSIKSSAIVEGTDGHADHVGGLFGLAGDGAVIKNCAFTGKIENDASDKGVVSKVNGRYIGGIVGTVMHRSVSIDNCYFGGNIQGSCIAGGIVGYIFDGQGNEIQISKCLSNGVIYGTNQQVGGIVGQSNVLEGSKVTISDSLSTSDVSAYDAPNKRLVGTIIGYQLCGEITTSNVYGATDSSLENRATGILGGYDKKYVSGTGFSVATATQIKNIADLYDVNVFANTELSLKDWTARVGMAPMLSGFAKTANYTKAAKLGSSYEIDTEISQNADGNYEITSVAELYGFALLSQKNNYSEATVVLKDYITLNPVEIDTTKEDAVYYRWLPIGNIDLAFAGTFDGQGKTISGLYAYGTSCIGLFAQTAAGSQVKNFKIENSYFRGGNSVGSVVGYNCAGTFDGIQSDAVVEGTDGLGIHVGGLFGYTKNSVVIKNCAYTGELNNATSDQTYYASWDKVANNGAFNGGIIGSIFNSSVNTTVDIENCYFGGTVNGAYYVGGIVGYINGSAKSAVNIISCLSDGTIYGTNQQIGGIIGTVNIIDQKTAIRDSLSVSDISAYATGRVVGTIMGYQRYGGVATSNVYGYNSNTTYEAINVLGAYHNDAKNLTITTATDVKLDNICGIKAYKNTALVFDRPETENIVEGYWIITDSTPELGTFSDSDNHQLIGQFRADTAWADASADGKYYISRPEELLGLARLVNATNSRNFAGETIYLINDIVINTGDVPALAKESTNDLYLTLPIGDAKKAFGGIFDGQGHTISGLYVYGSQCIGFFGQTAAGSQVKNFKIENSYFRGGNSVGSVVGFNCAGTFDGITSNAVVEGTDGKAVYIGGLFGYVAKSATMKNCAFTGKLTNDTSDKTFHPWNEMTGNGAFNGGIIGGIVNVSVDIENCYFGGIVNGAFYVGGIVGYINGNANSIVNIKHCLSDGMIYGTNQQIGGIVGSTNIIDQKTTISDSLSVSDISAYTTGRVLGTVVGYQNYGSVKTSNVYGYNRSTDTTGTQAILGGSNAKYVGGTSGFAATTATQITDITAWYDTKALEDNKLDANYWMARTGDVPVPKPFLIQLF